MAGFTDEFKYVAVNRLLPILLLALLGCQSPDRNDADSLRIEVQNIVTFGLRNYVTKNGPDPDLYLALAAREMRSGKAPAEIVSACRKSGHWSGESEVILRQVLAAWQRKKSAAGLANAVADGVDAGRKFR